jgi:hypothetical protein
MDVEICKIAKSDYPAVITIVREAFWNLGDTFNVCIARTRIEKAAATLTANPELPIAAIASGWIINSEYGNSSNK